MSPSKVSQLNPSSPLLALDLIGCIYAARHSLVSLLSSVFFYPPVFVAGLVTHSTSWSINTHFPRRTSCVSALHSICCLSSNMFRDRRNVFMFIFNSSKATSLKPRCVNALHSIFRLTIYSVHGSPYTYYYWYWMETRYTQYHAPGMHVFPSRCPPKQGQSRGSQTTRMVTSANVVGLFDISMRFCLSLGVVCTTVHYSLNYSTTL